MDGASRTALTGDLRRAVRQQAGLDFSTLAPAAGGESGMVFRAIDRGGTASIVKLLPDAGPGTADHLRTLGETVARLRERGYPAPRVLATGQVPGHGFWVQELLPGTPLDCSPAGPDPTALARLLPELTRLNDAQAGLGPASARSRWPELIQRTLTTGGDGYCVHETLAARPGTRHLLAAVRRVGDRHGADIPARRGFVHYDFTPANLLSDGTLITGVIDVNAPVIAGDRAFDLAVLLYYCYDHDELRTALRRRLLELTTPGAASAYLAHIALRQVDWSLRFHPGEPSTSRHLRLAEMAVADIGRIAGRRLTAPGHGASSRSSLRYRGLTRLSSTGGRPTFVVRRKFPWRGTSRAGPRCPTGQRRVPARARLFTAGGRSTRLGTASSPPPRPRATGG